MNTQIDLDIPTGKGKVHNLTGKDRGLHGRVFFEVDALDQTSESVQVIVPDHLDNISTSYFLGLFSKSIKSLGEDAFRSKYIFHSPKTAISRQIEHGIKLSLTLDLDN
jgi:hypothetical protein